MWSTILGHQKPIEQLRKALATRRLPNAYLFSGLSGIGKKLVATTFVSALFCPKSPDVCGSCISCSKIRNRSHPDVFFIEPKTEKILIEQVRDLKQNLQFHPLEGAIKIAVIDDADAMTEAAANSLLKILEEPPQSTHFILITAFTHRILPTIRSRCQKIVFAPLPEEDVTQYLIGQRGFDQRQALRIAQISQGSIGSVAELDPEFIDDVMSRFTRLLGNANAADIIAVSEAWAQEGDRVPLVFDLLMCFYRDLLCYRSTGIRVGFLSAAEPSLQGDGSAIMGTGRVSIKKLENAITSIARARDALFTTANKQLLFEQLLFTLTSSSV